MIDVCVKQSSPAFVVLPVVAWGTLAVLGAYRSDSNCAISSPDMSAMQITALEEVRQGVGLPLNKRGPQELEVAAGVHGLSEIELNTFVDMAEARYRAKRMDPGAPTCLLMTCVTNKLDHMCGLRHLSGLYPPHRPCFNIEWHDVSNPKLS